MNNNTDERNLPTLSDRWKTLDYEDSLTELYSDEDPTDYVSEYLCPDRIARLAYGGLSWTKIVRLFWANREYDEKWDSLLNSEFRQAWTIGHEIALHEARKELEAALNKAKVSEDKIDSSLISGLKLLHSMTEAAGHEQEKTQEDNSIMTDEEAQKILVDMGLEL